jgi:reactive intermediate/imine deaminase
LTNGRGKLNIRASHVIQLTTEQPVRSRIVVTVPVFIAAVAAFGCRARVEAVNKSGDSTNRATAGAVAESVTFLNSAASEATPRPFSEGVRIGNLIILSGQIGVQPGTMTLVSGGMAAEAKQTMDNIRMSLETHGSSMADVVKCTVMLADMNEWAAFNEIYKTYFTPPYPARSALGANGLALGAKVEVECMAAVRGH